METAGFPKFLGTPGVPWPCSPTPVGSVTPGHHGVPTRSPRLTRARTPTRSFRGSIAWPGHWLSTLRREGRPSTTQDSLPAAGQALPGGISYPQGSDERFLSSSLVLLSQLLGAMSVLFSRTKVRPLYPNLHRSPETSHNLFQDTCSRILENVMINRDFKLPSIHIEPFVEPGRMR